MASTLDITGAVQTAVAAWLTGAALSWSPRILTGYQRATAGDALGQMEAGGEPAVVIVECTGASEAIPFEPVFNCDVSVRVRHDPDRLTTPLTDHSARVKELADFIYSPDNPDLLSDEDDFTAFILRPTGQFQTSSGRSLETTITFSLRCCAATIA